MPAKSEAEAMQELASMLWSRFIRERVREELTHELNGFKAQVVTNNGDGTLTVKRPFESTNITLKASDSLSNSVAGDQVFIIGVGDKANALSNAFILGKTNMQDTRNLAREEQIAYIETGTTASRAYSVGEYFCWNGLLYQAKTAISSGAQFTVGTNCVQTNSTDKLTGLQSQLVASGTHNFALAPGTYLFTIKGLGNAACYGIYLVAISNGAGEYSISIISAGASAPTVSLSGQTLTVSVSYIAEIGFVNFTDFRA